MKTGIGFIISVALMLTLVGLESQLIGLKPPTPEIGSDERLSHLWLALTALGIVAGANALVIWLALLRHPHDNSG